ACALTPDAVADFGPLVEFEKQVIARDPKNWYHLVVYGAVRCRAGRDEEAVGTLTDSCAVHPKGGNATDWLFLALAHHHLGHADEARRWLEKATGLIERATHEDIKDTRTPTPLPWNDPVFMDWLRREAEALILGKPAPGPTKESADKK